MTEESEESSDDASPWRPIAALATGFCVVLAAGLFCVPFLHGAEAKRAFSGLVGYPVIGGALLAFFALDVWRRGKRRRALILAASIGLFALVPVGLISFVNQGNEGQPGQARHPEHLSVFQQPGHHDQHAAPLEWLPNSYRVALLSEPAGDDVRYRHAQLGVEFTLPADFEVMPTDRASTDFDALSPNDGAKVLAYEWRNAAGVRFQLALGPKTNADELANVVHAIETQLEQTHVAHAFEARGEIVHGTIDNLRGRRELSVFRVSARDGSSYAAIARVDGDDAKLMERILESVHSRWPDAPQE